MKKLSILISSLILFAGISFATSFQVKQDSTPKTEKKTDKKTDKKDVKKVPARKDVAKQKTTTNNNTPAK